MSIRVWGIVACVFLLTAPHFAMAKDKKLTVAIEWLDKNYKNGREVFGTVDFSEVVGRGLWVVFQKERNQNFPSGSLGGNLVVSHVPIEQMNSLELVVSVNGFDQLITKRSVLFSKTRPFGSKMATTENVYYLLVLDDFVREKDLPTTLDKEEVPFQNWEETFWRTHRLAMNYAARSDEKIKEYEEAFKVKAKYELPRLIIVAEEWLDIPEELQAKQKKESSGGPLNGKLNDIGEEISGAEKVVPKKIPIYSIDVLLDEISAKGKYPIAFQSARSVWNDMMEGEVIYHATGGNRRVVTASIVFSQMQKNKDAKISDNRILTVDLENIEVLDTCEDLWPAVNRNMRDFLKQNPDWKIVIPQRPVLFYKEGKPIYAMYAWYQVHPGSGRMKGVLPNGTRGAFTDEMAQLEETLVKSAHEKVGKSATGYPAKILFSQVAGMYVSTAGVLDGVNLTICNPAFSTLADSEWREFLGLHALDFCQLFLENHAGLYDSYASQLGFWQGAMIITSELGGVDAARECANKAFESASNKAIDDAKNYAKKAVKKEGKKAFDEAANTYAPRLKKAVKGLQNTKEYFDKGKEWVNKVKEAQARFKKALDDFEKKLIQRGLV